LIILLGGIEMLKKLIMVFALLIGFTSPSILLGITANAEEVSPEVHLDSDGVMRNFDPSTISETDIVSESPMVGLNENGETVIVPEENPMLRNAPKKKLIGEYILSGQDTISLAQSMKNLKGLPLENYVLNTLIALSGSKTAIVVQAALIASRNAAIKKVVIDAAAHGNRLRVLIWDEVPHTSYSTTVQFIAIR